MQNKLVLLTAIYAGLMGYTTSVQAGSQSIAQTEIAAVPAAPINLIAQGICKNGTPTFFVLNKGKKWPRTALVKLFYADDQSPIGQRRIRLKARQKISLAVKAGLDQGRPLGLWVEPSWYNRSFKFDANLNCDSKPSS